MKRIFLPCVLVLVFGFPAFSQVPTAQTPADLVVRFLGMSEPQAANFRQALAELQSRVSGVQARIDVKRQDLDAVLSAPLPDGNVAGKIVVEIAMLQRELPGAFEAYHKRFRDMLSPEQMGRVTQVIQARELLPAVAVFAAAQLVAPPGTPQN